MVVFAPKFLLGLALTVGIAWLAGGNTSLNSNSSSRSSIPSDNKTVIRTRQRRAKPIFLTQAERISFLQLHNQIRNDVGMGQTENPKIPTATGMMRMYWNAQLEASAVSSAMKCHTGARTKNYESQVVKLKEFTSVLSQYGDKIGHNQYSVSYKPTAVQVVTFFGNESEGFVYVRGKGGKCNSKGDCNSYLQLVWHTTFLVGCGYASCNYFYTTTCNYLPGANQTHEQPYIDGVSCSNCANYSFTECEGKLCVPKDRCSPVKECQVVDTVNCLCSESEYNKIVGRLLKASGSIHVASPSVVFGLLLSLVAVRILGQSLHPGYDAGLL